MENCETDITDVKRKSHASNICSSLLQDEKCAPKSLIDTCPVVPTDFMGKYNNCNDMVHMLCSTLLYGTHDMFHYL